MAEEESSKNQEPEKKNIPQYIKEMVEYSRWQGTCHICTQTTLMLNIEEIYTYSFGLQKSTAEGIMAEFTFSRRISRSKHRQLTAIAVTVYNAISAVSGTDDTKRKLKDGVDEAKLIDEYCGQRMAEYRAEKGGGNFKYVDEIEEDCSLEY